jgi:starch phosphorylase
VLLRRHLREEATLATLADRVAIQLNDTHPAIAIAEGAMSTRRRARLL